MQKKLPTIFHKLIDKKNRDETQKCFGFVKKNREVIRLSVKNYFSVIEETSKGLKRLGIKKNSKVGIIGSNSYKWHLTDVAGQCLGAIVVPIYPTVAIDEIYFILNNSKIEYLVIGNHFLFKKISSILEESSVKKILFLDDITKDINSDLLPIAKKYKYSYFEDLKVIGKKIDTTYSLEKSIAKLKETDIATIIYTSGTTGKPKGAIHTHKSINTTLENLGMMLDSWLTNSDESLTFLPFSHVLGRFDSYMHFHFNSTTILARGIERLAEDMKLVKPTYIISVPRVFEKVYDTVLKRIQNESSIKNNIFKLAERFSKNYYDLIDHDSTPNMLETLEKKLAFELVYSKVYENFGGKIRILVTGGAPLPSNIYNFFKFCNLQILEGYGLTETFGPAIINPLYKQIENSIGIPIGNTKIKLSIDNEILLKSDALFIGYENNIIDTKSSFTKDGYYKTGDLAKIDNFGFTSITGRKKDIIVTSAGKNIAPQKIESLMTTSPYIESFVTYGNNEKFLAGVVQVSLDNIITELSKEHDLKNTSMESISKNSLVNSMIKKEIRLLNKRLSKHEEIKKVFISPIAFTQDNNLLTPSLKVKKQEIIKHFKKDIDSLYVVQ